MKELLVEFRKAIPFLEQISDEIFFKLDPSSFHLPEGEVKKLREELQEKLGHYVMTYKSEGEKFDGDFDTHLCAHLKSVKLTKGQKRLLGKYEGKLKPLDVSLCIYQKPLELI
ncbi:MAG: hypothetical protein GF368_01900 [Candidatus Aenigmarchaeota archaeon]|nr:hypothetical protein [Candidatus Aenigmarchaeota archaeon]